MGSETGIRNPGSRCIVPNAMGVDDVPKQESQILSIPT